MTYYNREEINDLAHVRSNPDLIFCFDNAIDSSTLDDINEFNWKDLNYSKGRFENTSGHYKVFDFNNTDYNFIHQLQNIATTYFKSIDSTATMDRIISIPAILSDDTENLCQHQIHPDAPLPGRWSCLFHLIGSAGPTNFYSNFSRPELIKSIEFKPGRLIIFPAMYPHKGNLPSNKTNRVTVNFVTIVSTVMNKEMLKFTPTLHKKYNDFINRNSGYQN